MEYVEIFKRHLDSIVGCDQFRPQFNQPWVNNDKLQASDTHILVQIPVPDDLSQFNLSEYSFDISKAIEDTPAKDLGSISSEELRQIIDKIPVVTDKNPEYEECPECSGCGEVEASYYCGHTGTYHYFDVECPYCDGSGKIQSDEDCESGPYRDPEHRICLNEFTFDTEYLETLANMSKDAEVNFIKVTQYKYIFKFEITPEFIVYITGISPQDNYKQKYKLALYL